ncbi:hypothetical protein HXX76_015917 [Chlamydomonas incerta]|uniref:Mitochondrial carrier protein n=1 Tax=Chlamydomonas incerta TaxID=51695 RepID=A0A835S938_CHLIN|nr:hypothetical protein HXX76_015917 [Chlamydomonas incerta]|eukprot:KAG2422589.1 hypothetical protein HXX76_015917 [Chlamydomonas incerta]
MVGGCIENTHAPQGSVYVPTRAVVDATVPPEQTAWGPAAAAAAGSIAASSVRVPLQFELILRREGPRALYRGWVRSVSKNAPFDAVLFLLYDIGKTRVTERNRERVDAAATGGGSREASLAAAAGSQGQADPVASGVVMERVGAGSRDGAGDWDPGACSRAGAAAGGADESGSGGNEAELYPAADAALVGGLAGALTGLLTSPPEVWRLRGQLLQQQAAEAAATAAEAASAGGQRAALAAALRGSLRSRVLWAALEGAVFFSALETLIPLCDRALLPAADSQQHSAEPAAGGDGGSGFSETAGLLGGGSPLRHPAHPLHW